MEMQSDEWLQMCINNQHQFVPDAIQAAAKWEIQRREELKVQEAKDTISTNDQDDSIDKKEKSIVTDEEQGKPDKEVTNFSESYVPFLNNSLYLKEMLGARNQIHSFISENDRPKWYSAFRDYFKEIGYATKLLFIEKHLIVLALLQWVFIALGYYIWLQILDWIPVHIWDMALNSQVPIIVDIVFLLWSLIIVGIVAFPIGILTACMGAVHFLHQQDSDVKLSTCFKAVLPNAWSIWIFSWIDSWWTVSQILDRLPKKGGGTWTFKGELIYLAWKLGTMGMIPAMVTGKRLRDAGIDSVNFIKVKLKKAATTRLGYSTVCWFVGILTYIGTIYFLFTEPGTLDFTYTISTQMYAFYFWVGIPTLLSTGVILVFLRPVYIITSCDLYSQYLTKNSEVPLLNEKAGKWLSAIIVLLTLMLFVLVIYLFREQLGIIGLLSP